MSEMKLPASLGTLDWSDWLRGVIGGFIGGGAAAFGSGGSAMLFIDPSYIASHGVGFIVRMMGGTFLLSGIMSTMLFLAKKPIPDSVHVTEVKTQTISGGQQVAPTVIETKKETTISQEQK